MNVNEAVVQADKKPYVKPMLATHGSVQQLTEGGHGHRMHSDRHAEHGSTMKLPDGLEVGLLATLIGPESLAAMPDYAAYGLIIHCEFPLPELVEASALASAPASRPKGEADVRITLAPPELPRPRHPAHPPDSTWATPDSAFVEYPDAAGFFIRDGREIIIHLVPGADDRAVRLYLLGPILALLLHQRHLLVLHASAVSIRGRAVAFIADKGMGKSTMAAALHSRGHPLVADDLVVIDSRAARPTVYPGFPQLKLFPESAALLDGDPQALPRVHPDLEKRSRRSAVGFPTEPLPLRRIFVLADGDREAIEPLPARAAFMELVRHTFLLGFLKVTGSAELHFRQVSALAASVPVVRLLRRRSLEILPLAAQLAEDEIERAA